MKSILLALGITLVLSTGGQAVKLTAYNAHPSQTDSNPRQSACGPTVMGQVALSPDLKRKYPCGTYIKVWRPDTKRWHSYLVNDSTSSRKRNQVDILMRSRSAALKFGVREGRIK